MFISFYVDNCIVIFLYFFLTKSSVSPYYDFLFIRTSAVEAILYYGRPPLQHETPGVCFMLENVMLRSGRLKLIVEAHIGNKIKTVDGGTLCFINAIYYDWSKDYETGDSFLCRHWAAMQNK